MQARIYWAIRHSVRAVHELRFHIRCWGLRRQISFLEWRLRLESLMPAAPTDAAHRPVRQGGPYGVPTM